MSLHKRAFLPLKQSQGESLCFITHLLVSVKVKTSAFRRIDFIVFFQERQEHVPQGIYVLHFDGVYSIQNADIKSYLDISP
jgi:hypothetical protein